MTIEETRASILERLETINDEVTLQRIIDFIESYESTTTEADSLDFFYERVKAQYGNVLQKLAQ